MEQHMAAPLSADIAAFCERTSMDHNYVVKWCQFFAEEYRRRYFTDEESKRQKPRIFSLTRKLAQPTSEELLEPYLLVSDEVQIRDKSTKLHNRIEQLSREMQAFVGENQNLFEENLKFIIEQENVKSQINLSREPYKSLIEPQIPIYLHKVCNSLQQVCARQYAEKEHNFNLTTDNLLQNIWDQTLKEPFFPVPEDDKVKIMIHEMRLQTCSLEKSMPELLSDISKHIDNNKVLMQTDEIEPPAPDLVFQSALAQMQEYLNMLHQSQYSKAVFQSRK